ncbi:MAG: hypoxanthine phosphoribosyltransferase [Candidatus Cybelea sp.]
MTAECGADVGPTICTSAEIAEAIERLAASIAEDYRGKPLLLLGVLKGALCFTADLARAISGKADGPSEMMIDYVLVERYGSLGSTGGEPRMGMDCKHAVAGANVLIADDIVDNGRTLHFLRALLAERGPASLRSCALFDRPARREVAVAVEYLGIEIPDVFAIGYGLDYKELYRNLPYLAELREEKTV